MLGEGCLTYDVAAADALSPWWGEGQAVNGCETARVRGTPPFQKESTIMSETLHWGILGTGAIAGTFAKGIKDSRTGALAAVGSRTQESADRFGEEHGVERRHGSYEALLADPEVQAVYISTPHPMHAEWAIQAAEAGKHILCEKPLTLNSDEAMAVVEAARRHGVFLMEAFMYRCHPQTAKLVELIRDGAIGEVKVIHASFSFRAGDNPESRLLKNALGGGGILDVGCYCASMARLIAGAATGKPFADPVQVQGMGHVGETGVDEYAVANLKFPGDILAQISTGVRVNQDNMVRIYGTEGSIGVPSPWFCSPTDGAVRIVLNQSGKDQQIVTVETDRSLYAYEADAFAEGVRAGETPHPAMSSEDSLGNMKTLDRWRLAFGMVYDAEKPEGLTRPVHGRTLAPRPDHTMRYDRVPGVDKPVAKIVMGTMLEGAIQLHPHAAVLFDEYLESGGNCFDTAYIYAGGKSEEVLGGWVKRRGVRDQVVILAKGAHTPYCTPEWLTKQFMETLDRLQMDYVDLYLMHRDNLEVPAGEFVDVLNEHKNAGRIGAFGGSNWSLERVDAANAYAEANGLTGFTAISNNFSLARMVEPIWDGCIAASDPDSKRWLVERQMANFSWSSQARGFFVRADPNDTSDDELVRTWYSPENFERKRRAEELAQKKGTLPINIAAAYVLQQPFPSFALVGPRALSELTSSMAALGVELSPEEIRWLDLEE
jgi:predicted dehydrogenase/aryl-alcohol dehydrogenase-like predicted oxidoreductase